MRLGLTHMGNIDIAIKAMAEKLEIDWVMTPATSQRTLSLGVKYSPETVCLPFKLQLGDMIEALELGADTLLMPGGNGPCRFGYYHKVHEPILRELGYKFQMVTQEQGILQLLKNVTNDASKGKVITAFLFGLTKLKTLEELQRMVNKIRAIERDKGEATRIYKESVLAIDDAGDYPSIKRAKHEHLQKLASLPTVASPDTLIVGITGEFFVVVDPFANMDIEIELGKLGVEVRRSVFIGELVRLNPLVYTFGLLEKAKAHRAAMPYLSRHVGGDGWQSVGEKVLHTGDWDGLVHLEPFGCVPEIMARNIMPSTNEDLPVLNIIVDEHTAKTGVITRLEAFVDMLEQKKRRKAEVCV